MHKPTHDDFKKELKKLLEKYNATIGFAVGEHSDLHGVYGEKIVVEFRPKGEPLSQITLSDGYWINKKEL